MAGRGKGLHKWGVWKKKARSSATAERQYVILGSFTDRALHWTPHLLYNYNRHCLGPNLFHNLQSTFLAANSMHPSGNGLSPLLGIYRSTEVPKTNSYRHYQLTNRPYIRGRWSLQTSYTFKVICLCITRKPLRAFIIIHITYYKRPHTSRYLTKWCCAA